MKRLAVIGNGLAISASASFEMLPLTTAVRAELGTINGGVLLQRLEDAGRLLVPANFHPDRNFEHLLGPFDRLTLLLRGPLLGLVGAASAQRAALAAAATEVDRLYVRGVGAVLGRIDAPAVPVVIAPVRAVVNWITAGLGADNEASIYTVNYDALLDQELLEAQRNSHGALRLDDEFAPLGGTATVTLPLPGAPSLHLIGLRPPQLLRPGNLHLFHLHGALQWVEYSGETWKVKEINELRVNHVFDHWRDGKILPVRPRLILTDQKDRAVGLDPFASDYTALRTDLAAADRVLIAGYGFGDVPLNDELARAWRNRAPAARWLIVCGRTNPVVRNLRALEIARALRTHIFAMPTISWRGLPWVTGAVPLFWT